MRPKQKSKETHLYVLESLHHNRTLDSLSGQMFIDKFNVSGVNHFEIHLVEIKDVAMVLHGNYETNFQSAQVLQRRGQIVIFERVQFHFELVHCQIWMRV